MNDITESEPHNVGKTGRVLIEDLALGPMLHSRRTGHQFVLERVGFVPRNEILPGDPTRLRAEMLTERARHGLAALVVR